MTVSGVLLFAALLVLAVLSAPRARADGALLSNDQRRAYLTYYAPLLFKQGDENDGKAGRDWMTNFDFDTDGNFSNNRTDWLNVKDYVAASATGNQGSPYRYWRIRPTMYTALLEYRAPDGSKSLTLLYHVYNAADKDGKEIHDWERVEINIGGVTGTPGAAGERFLSSAITHHKEHIGRSAADADSGAIQFYRSGSGNHLMLWQADESDYDLPSAGPHGHELRYVKNPIGSLPINSTAGAKVNISGANESYRVHYVFVPPGDAAAGNAFGARTLTFATAGGLSSGQDNGTTIAWNTTRRIGYELQDLSDIIPTHWSGGPWSTNWTADRAVDIALDTPITDESGVAVVPAGLQHFYTGSKDGTGSDGRAGLASKGWLYGDYSAEYDEDTPSDTDEFDGYGGQGVGTAGTNRAYASGDYNSLGHYWRQHDFFSHDGGLIDSEHRESGRWLPAGWADAANGGFDGRWAQLFDDRSTTEATAPLEVYDLTNYRPKCTDYYSAVAQARGGAAPYAFVWTNADSVSTSGNTSRARVASDAWAEVSVTSADGQRVRGSFHFVLDCGSK